jgi:hypothetical protein
MPLSQRDRNKVIDGLNTRFAEIGTKHYTCPPSTRNTEATAWEFFVAAHLQTIAAGRLKEARASAVRAGVIFDHDKHPRTPQDTGVLYRGDNVVVTLTVKAPTVTVDVDEVCAFLIDKGVSVKLVSDAVEHSRRERRAAHEFRASLLTED